MNFESDLDLAISSDLESDRSSILTDSINTAKEYAETKYKMIELDNKLKTLKHKLNCEMAIKCRRIAPYLNIDIHRGNCRIGYKSKSMLFRPDFKRMIWLVEGPDILFVNRFKRMNRKTLDLYTSLETIIETISKYFKECFKSITESKENGRILIEGKISTLIDIINYKRNEHVIN